SSGIGENQFLHPISVTNNGGFYGFGNMAVIEAWTDSSGGQYFAIGTDLLDFEVSSTQDEHWHYIDYVLIDPSKVSVRIYDTQSQLVKTLFDGSQFSGPCNFVWDGSDNTGQQSSTGDYRVVVVDTSGYRNIETETPVNVVTKEAWFHHVYNPGGCCNTDGIRGDVDMSGSLNVSDVTYLVAYLKGLGPVPPCPDEADVNGSGTVNVADVTYLNAYLKGLGPQPPACM
ncbi:MAG: FlgD immunoglobulin-like domain containing protein, partial [Candidatus Zixiibacteriota bacterium]